MIMCVDCVFRNMCSSDLSSMLNNCWSAVDNDFNNDECVLSRKDKEGHWREMSWYKTPMVNDGFDCYELSEWDIYMKEEEKELILSE